MLNKFLLLKYIIPAFYIKINSICILGICMKTLCDCVHVCVCVSSSPSGYTLLTVTSRVKVTAVLALACSDVGHLWPPSDVCWPQIAVCLTDDLRSDHTTPLPALRNVTLKTPRVSNKNHKTSLFMESNTLQSFALHSDLYKMYTKMNNASHA